MYTEMFFINTNLSYGLVLPENTRLLTLPKDSVASLRPQIYNDRRNSSCVIVERMIGLIQRHRYSDVMMSAIASQITGVSMICSIVSSGWDQRKRQSSASLAFVRVIHRSPANSHQKGPVTRKMFPFNDVIMEKGCEHVCMVPSIIDTR